VLRESKGAVMSEFLSFVVSFDGGSIAIIFSTSAMIYFLSRGYSRITYSYFEVTNDGGDEYIKQSRDDLTIAFLIAGLQQTILIFLAIGNFLGFFV